MPVIGRLFYEIGGDTDRLQADLRKAVDMAKDAGLDIKRAGQSFLASFNEALNPTGLLTEKLRLLEAAGKSNSEIMAVMGNQIKAAAETAKANSQAIDPLVQKYADLANAAKGGGFSIESLGKTLTDFARNPMSAAKEGIGSFAEKLGPAAIGLAGIASAAIAAGAAIFKLAESTANEAEQITNLSLRTGIGVERVQSLQKAAELMGVSGETVISAVSKINLELGKFGTGGEFTKGITALGISLEDASGKAKPAVDLLSELRTKLLEIEDPSERAQVATAVLGRRNQELVPLLLNAKDNLFDLAKQLEDTGAVMDKVAVDQAMKLDEKLDILSVRFAKVKTIAKEAAVETALAVSDIFTGDFWKLLASNLAKGAGMQAASLASLQMRIKEAADAAIEASKKHEEAGKKAADAAGLARMKEEELYNERLKLLSQGKENVDLLLKLQEAQEKLNTAVEKGLSHKEKEKALSAVLSIRDQIKAREDEARAYEKALDAVERMQRERYEAAEKLRQKETEEEKKRLEDQHAFSAKLQMEINKAAAGLEKIKPENPLKDLLPTEKDIRDMERRSAEFNRIAGGWGKEAVSIGEEMRKQISTVVNDFGRQVAGAIVHWKGLGNAVKEFFSSLAESTLRIVIERLFNPLQKLLGDAMDSLSERFFGGGKKTTASPAPAPVSGSWGNLLGTVGSGLPDWLKAAATPAEEGPSISEILTAGNPLLQVYRPVEFSAPRTSPGFVGPTLDMVKGGAPAGGIFGVGGTAGSMIQGGLMAGGTAAFLDSFSQKGVRGWAEAIGGGAAIGAAIGSVVPVIGTAIGAAIGAAAGALAKGIQSLVTAIKGKNAYQAGSMELGRDFGGITMSPDDFKKWLGEMGISESQTYPIRKDIESSSKFLAEVAGPLAAAQGKTQEFLKSLELVKTASGTFDFRKHYQLGELTGDWSALDEAFKAAFKDSQALNQNVPDWQSKLLMLGDATRKTAADFQNLYKQFDETKTVSDEFSDFLKENAEVLDEAAKSSSAFADELEVARKALELKPLLDGLKSLRDGISGMIPAVETMYDRFLKTGEITEEFAAKITELGGDISKFTEVSGLVKLNSYFAEMVQHFRDTGEILPDLRDLFQQFGGDLSALDKAADLSGLKSSLGFIEQLSDELTKFLPEQTAIQKLMAGNVDQSVIDALTGAGIAPESLTKITGLLKMETGWDDAIKKFQDSGKLLQGGLLEQALSQYGGSAGQTAVSRYGEGFNTVTDQLLAATKAAMDAAFRNERTGVLDILKQAAGDITTQVGNITKPIEDQFTIVSTNIQTAFQTAAAAAIAELDKILAKIEEIKDATKDIVPEPVTPGAGDTQPVEPEPVEPVPTAEAWQGAYIDLRGATIFGYDEFARRVAEAQALNARRSGLAPA